MSSPLFSKQSAAKMLGQPLLAALGLGIAYSMILAPSAKAFTVVNKGTDYLATPSGASAKFSIPGLPSPITVSLKGLPIGTPTVTPPDGGYSSAADTVINRYDNVMVSGGETPSEIVGLSLQSVSPVNIGGSAYDIFVGLQKYYTLGPDPNKS
jgi:hypothetical protein